MLSSAAVYYSYCPAAKSSPSIVFPIVLTEVEYREFSSATIEWLTNDRKDAEPGRYVSMISSSAAVLTTMLSRGLIAGHRMSQEVGQNGDDRGVAGGRIGGQDR